MRLVLYFSILLFLTCCRSGVTKKDNTSVILDYIDLNVTQKNYDTRIYNPPPPPELKDSIGHGGIIKDDSIINKLEKLKIFINDSIRFSENLTYKNEDLVKEFLFLENIHRSISIPLDVTNLKERKGINLESVYVNKFLKLYPKIRLENNFGGLLNFQNLFISKNGKKAYFEVSYFKQKLNTVTYAIFAEFKDGQWIYKSEIISIS